MTDYELLPVIDEVFRNTAGCIGVNGKVRTYLKDGTVRLELLLFEIEEKDIEKNVSIISDKIHEWVDAIKKSDFVSDLAQGYEKRIYELKKESDENKAYRAHYELEYYIRNKTRVEPIGLSGETE